MYDIFNPEMNFEINSLTNRKSKAEVSDTIESLQKGVTAYFPSDRLLSFQWP